MINSAFIPSATKRASCENLVSDAASAVKPTEAKLLRGTADEGLHETAGRSAATD